MIVFPTGTDAPIYYWPKVTVLFIVLNIAAFFLVPVPGSLAETVSGGVAEARFQRYALVIGDGLHPLQWVTSNFLHASVTHLAGNMLFLWAFGIVVEGKLGPFKFALAYFLIGTLAAAAMQVALLHSGLSGHAVGASAVIFGLLGMCMIWAPRNELSCLVIFIMFLRSFVSHWDLRYTTVALIYIGGTLVNLVWGGLLGRRVATELAHLSGVFWGIALAIGILKAGWVDCEGWDVFTLAAKRRKLAKDWKLRGERLDRQNRTKRPRKPERAASDKSAEERSDTAVQRVQKLIAMGDYAGAVATFDKSARTLERWPAQADLLSIIKALHAARADVESIPLMRAFCRNYTADATRMRLKLAQVLIRDRQRPTAAQRVLAELPASGLPPELDAVRKKLAQQAAQMVADGVLELEEDD